MYSVNEYKQLTAKYGSYASWAIWDYEKSEDTAVIDNCIDQLHSKYVLLGLNMSRLLNRPDWFNFHDNTHARKLKYACNDTLLRGSYMTDIFKDLFEPNSVLIKNMLTEQKIEENVVKFNLEMIDIKANSDTQFITFGQLTTQYFEKYFKQDYKKPIYCTHYSYYKLTDKEWVKRFWEILSIKDDLDNTLFKYKKVINSSRSSMFQPVQE